MFQVFNFNFFKVKSVESLNNSILDLITCLKESHSRKVLTIIMICLVCFLCGLIFCTQSGSYWLQLFDSYSGNWSILIVASLELISIGWFYGNGYFDRLINILTDNDFNYLGFENFRKDISTMIGEKLTNHFLFNIWGICWIVISPGIIFVGISFFSSIIAISLLLS